MKSNFFSKNFKSETLFFLELFILPCFVLLDIIAIRFFLVLIYLHLAKLNGKKVSLVYFSIMFLSIVLFHLLSLNGEIIFSYAFIKITKGALLGGINHGLLIIGFVFISLFCVQKDLYIPFKLGDLLSLMLIYYQVILEGKKNRIKKNSFIEDVDSFLEEVYNSKKSNLEKVEKKNTKKAYVFILALVLINFLFLYYKYYF